MKIISFFYILSLILIVNVGTTAHADQSRAAARIAGFTITADNLSRDLDKNTLSLFGNVEVTYKNQSFKADTIEINQNTRQATLKGNVQIFTVDYEIGGDEIRLDYEADQSIIINGYVKSNNVQFQGQLIEQESTQNFKILQADYTTCSNCPASWSFSGTQIKAELGGYAFLKNPFLKVSGIPIFWLPYLVVPLKNERQSGLLNPEIDYIQNRKIVLGQSFFWAIDRSQDLTFTLKNYELGGLKELIEYRYVLSDTSYGEFHVAQMNDSVFKSEPRYNYFRNLSEKENHFNRWIFKGDLYHSLSEDTKLQIKLNQVSDLQYPKDFFEEFKNYAESGLENRLTLSQRSDQSLLSFDTIYFKHLLEADPLSDNSAAVHKLPEVRFETQFQSIADSAYYYKISVDGTNFSRSKSYDDISISADGQKFVTNTSNNPACDRTLNPNSTSTDCEKIQDGQYNEGVDLLRTGQRLNLKTTLTRQALSVSTINISPQLTYSDTQYYFSEGSKTYNRRRFAQFELLSRSKLYNIYDSTSTQSPVRYKHELIPELTYTWIPWIDHDTHPFFGGFQDSDTPFKSSDQIKDTDINSTEQNSLQFDINDRIYEKHIIKFSLLNRVIKKNMKDLSYAPILTFNVSQSYDLYQTVAKDNINKPLSTLDGTLNMTLNSFSFDQQIKYSPYAFATDSTSSLTYQNLSGQYLKLGYVSNRINASTKVDDLALAIGFVTRYLNLLTGVVIDTSENRSTDSRLKMHSMIAQFKPPGECWGINFFRDQKIGGGEKWSIRFDFSFDGKPTKVIPPAELKLAY